MWIYSLYEIIKEQVENLLKTKDLTLRNIMKPAWFYQAKDVIGGKNKKVHLFGRWVKRSKMFESVLLIKMH